MSDVPASIASADNAIEITVPLRTEHAATLRVIVASLGSDHGLSVDEIDDLKLAVSEVFTVLIDGAGTKAHVRYLVQHDAITIEFDGGDVGPAIELDVLASTILSSVVDEHHVNNRRVPLVKRGAETRR